MSDSDPGQREVTRRKYLKYSATIALVGTAGCSGDGSTGTTGAEETDPPTASPTPSPTSEPTASPTPTDQPAEESCAATEPALPSSEEGWWPMFQYDPQNTGYSSEATGPTEEVGTAWTFDTDGKVRSSPAIVDETVYIGSYDGNLYALDFATGEEQWIFETEGPITSSPGVLEDTVYVGSHDHRVYALNAKTGEERWQYETGGPVRSSPTIATPSWREHGTIVIGSDDGNVYYFDAPTGEKQFEYDINGPVVSAPYVADFTTPNGVLAPHTHGASTDADGSHQAAYLTTRGGSKDEINLPRPFISKRGAPVHAAFTAHYSYDSDGAHYRPADDGKLRKVWHPKGAGGDQVTEFETGGKIRSSPALSKDPVIVYFGSWDGGVYAVSDALKEQIWRFETEGKVESSPALTKEAVYVGSRDHHVYGLDAASGSKLWDFRTGGPVHSSPAVVNGTVLVGSDDGSLYAFTECQ